MYISLFVEIDEVRNPLYFEEYKRACERDTIIIASKEYVKDEYDKEKVWVIPDEIMKIIDDFVEKPENRTMYLQIKRCLELEGWIENKVATGNKFIEGIITNKEYPSIQEATEYMRMEWLVQMGNRFVSQAKSNSEYMIDELKSHLLQEENARKSLEGYIKSTENYLQQLQIHATKLDEDCKKYKVYYDQHEENSEYIKKLEAENNKYAEKYKTMILELDKLKTEKLNNMV